MRIVRLTAAALGVAAITTAPYAALAQRRPPRDTTMHRMPMAMGDTALMAAAPLGISMERMGSGTTWIPDAVSLPSRHFMRGPWELMLHGFVFGQYDKQEGRRGDEQFGSLNWGMFMASRDFGGGRFQARTMLSLDPATVSNRGYPLLLQSGERFDGAPLHDRQHPHDFWMEMAVLYERPVSERLGLSFYAAPSGEPALGPVAFMHRPSAMDNPFAPLGHHWQDATHISFGVLTAGLFTRAWKLEGSVFNGREPNDERWDVDRIALDSYSGRLTVNPDRHWSLSAGYGYLANPEGLSPKRSIHRVTASVLHGTALGAEGQWASALVYGANRSYALPAHSTSVLLESEAILDRWHTILGRVEYARKGGDDLALQFFDPDRLYDLKAFSLGYIRELARGRGATLGLGAVGTVNLVPTVLEDTYGSRTPLGGMVFIRLRPFHQHAKTMPGMNGMKMENASAAARRSGRERAVGAHHASGGDVSLPFQVGHDTSDSADVARAVHAYHAAEAAGDSAAMLVLLADDAVILESGGVETREDFRAHHIAADIAFSRSVRTERGPIRVRTRGDVAWASSTSTSQGSSNGRTINSSGAELMVLVRQPAGWRIAAIHWSSRQRRTP